MNNYNNKSTKRFITFITICFIVTCINIFAFLYSIDCGLFFLSMTIGVVIGVFVSLYLGWIYRIFKRTKSKSYFYDIDDNTVVETRHDNSDHHFVRLVIRNNELTDTIAFRFTDYFFKPNKVNIKLNSNNRFDFDYFEKNYEKNKDWIDHYQDGEIVEFMKNIFFVARNNEERPEEIILSTNLLNVKEILNIKITE